METHCLLFMCVNIKLDKVDAISNLFRTLFLDGFVEVVKEEKTVDEKVNTVRLTPNTSASLRNSQIIRFESSALNQRCRVSH